MLDRLVDEVGEDESHPLASLMEIVGVLIEKYEDEHVPELSKVGPHINARGFLKPLGLTANALAKAIGNHAAT